MNLMLNLLDIFIKLKLFNIMFCCTRKQAHQGEIVTSICVESQCIQNENQLCCVECVKEDHFSGHEIVSMKNMIPQLLQAHNAKHHYLQLLKELLLFISDQCGSEECLQSFGGVDQLSVLNIVDATKVLISQMKKRNQQQNKKIKEIEKTLQVNNPKQLSQLKSQMLPSSPQKQTQNFYSTIKTETNANMKASNFNYNSVPISASQITNLDTFSHTLKHPYASISSDMRSATKTSPVNGYKLAIHSGAPFPQVQSQPIILNLKIQKSGGNIMIGLGHPQIIKQKQFINCYGIGQGAYVLGQNGNDPTSAIIFHHSNNIYNRKQIVAWNFKEGDVVGIGIMKDSGTPFILFRKYQKKENGKVDLKKVDRQFSMPLYNPQQGRILQFYLLVLLQNVGDQVSILQEQ